MFKHLTKKAKIFIATFIAFFVIIILISILSLTNNSTQDYTSSGNINITNWSDHTSAPVGYKGYLQDLIWATIKEQNPSTPVTAIIRENTKQEEKTGDTLRTSFIIDLPDQKYSFRGHFFWAEGQTKAFTDPTVYLSCPLASEVIYPESPCLIGTHADQLSAYLPTELTLDDGTQLNLTLNKYADYQKFANQPYVSVSIPTCKDYAQLTGALSKVNAWLESLYQKPSDFHIEISCMSCNLNSEVTGTDRCLLTNDTDNQSDPLLNELPYADVNFKVEPSTTEGKKIRIIILIDRASKYYPSRIDEGREAYLKQALDWIKSRGFNISDYPYEVSVQY